MDIDMGPTNSGLLIEQKNQGTVISEGDLAEPNKNVLAELAM